MGSYVACWLKNGLRLHVESHRFFFEIWRNIGAWEAFREYKVHYPQSGDQHLGSTLPLIVSFRICKVLVEQFRESPDTVHMDLLAGKEQEMVQYLHEKGGYTLPAGCLNSWLDRCAVPGATHARLACSGGWGIQEWER